MIDLKKYIGNEGGYFSGINIVPFTDVVLVLLIIFMIAAPGLVRSGLDVRLPGAKSGQEAGKARLRLGLTREGKLYLDGKPIATTALKAELERRKKENPALGVILNADRRTPHGKVIAVLDTIRLVGIKRIYVGAVRK